MESLARQSLAVIPAVPLFSHGGVKSSLPSHLGFVGLNRDLWEGRRAFLKEEYHMEERICGNRGAGFMGRHLDAAALW